MAKKNGGPIDFSYFEKMKRENPDDFFSDEEAERRLTETMKRAFGGPGTFDMETGQNYGEPKLSEEELKRRGYPCKLS